MTKRLVVDLDKCTGGHRCPAVLVCQMDALYQVDVHSAPEVNRNLCVGCGACVRRCAKQALRVIEG
ncbi:MAG: 4Fe-4S binding protein [Peptococcaceae bacterium]|nr:4Fe-4S binding protein [Peptococcaceae bacterium]